MKPQVLDLVSRNTREKPIGYGRGLLSTFRRNKGGIRLLSVQKGRQVLSFGSKGDSGMD